MTGYVINFPGHGLFDPDGKVEGMTQDQVANHNRMLAEAEVDQAKKTGKGIFYLTWTQNPNDKIPGIKRYYVGTWDGSHKWNCYVKCSHHNFAGRDGRRDVWFNLEQEPGYLWHGVNIGNNDIVRCKRLASKARRG